MNVTEVAKDYGIVITQEMEQRFQLYAQKLDQWNQKMNLTAITSSDEVVIKHFLDSLLVMKAVDLPQEASLLDVGTGAGFPGVPLKIVREDLHLTLLDSLQKRILFLDMLSEALGQSNDLIHGRAEELGRDKALREGYDVVTARAVAALPVLCEYCMPFVKVGGYFVALKGYDVEEELASAQKSIKVLGGELPLVKKFQLPMDNKRGIVIIKKISQTPPQYPRISAKIAKSPI